MAPATMDDGPRNAPSTAGGFVLVSVYSWMLVTLGVAIVRFAQVLLVVHKVSFGPDDAAILAASIAYLGATVGWQYAVYGGLGKDAADMNPDDILLFFKSTYVAVLLGITAMACAKLSCAFLIDRVAPQTRRAKMILFGIIAIYSFFSIFAIAFECGVPRWTIKALRCGNGGLLEAATVLNMVTDLVLAGWIIPTLWSLSLDRDKCIIVAVLFGSRATVAIVAAAQLWAVVKANNSKNPSRAAVNLALLTQAVTSLSLIVATIPRIKRFLNVGGSGILYPDVHETEFPLSRRSLSHQHPHVTEPKLVPSGTGRSTVTVTSKGTQGKKKGRPQSDWQGFVTMSSKEDEHTSTSSLFEREDHGGVMMQQEVRVSVEQSSARRIP